MGILNYIAIRPEGVAGAMHTDLQAEIGPWGWGERNKSRKK